MLLLYLQGNSVTDTRVLGFLLIYFSSIFTGVLKVSNLMPTND